MVVLGLWMLGAGPAVAAGKTVAEEILDLLRAGWMRTLSLETSRTTPSRPAPARQIGGEAGARDWVALR
jgi:hypothetical protein